MSRKNRGVMTRLAKGIAKTAAAVTGGLGGLAASSGALALGAALGPIGVIGGALALFSPNRTANNLGSIAMLGGAGVLAAGGILGTAGLALVGASSLVMAAMWGQQAYQAADKALQ